MPATHWPCGTKMLEKLVRPRCFLSVRTESADSSGSVCLSFFFFSRSLGDVPEESTPLRGRAAGVANAVAGVAVVAGGMVVPVPRAPAVAVVAAAGTSSSMSAGTGYCPGTEPAACRSPRAAAGGVS